MIPLTEEIFKENINDFPEYIWIYLSSQIIEAARPKEQLYSYPTARYFAHLNRIVLSTLRDILGIPENDPKANSLKTWLPDQKLPHIWEFVNGSAIYYQETKIIIIPTEDFNTEVMSIPKEWIDLDNWAGHYYIAIQMDLAEGWLRVWGFTTHKIIKEKGTYQPSDQTYHIPLNELSNNLDLLWFDIEQGLQETAPINPLPELKNEQLKRLFYDLVKPKLYSPRLKLEFQYWGPILNSELWRRMLYKARLGEEISWVSNKNQQPDILPTKFVPVRSSPLLNRVAMTRGDHLDYGLELAQESFALIININNAPEINNVSENKRKVIVQVHHMNKSHLPPGVKLTIFDQEEDQYKETVISRDNDNCIQRVFIVPLGYLFAVMVEYGTDSMRQNIIVDE